MTNRRGFFSLIVGCAASRVAAVEPSRPLEVFHHRDCIVSISDRYQGPVWREAIPVGVSEKGWLVSAMGRLHRCGLDSECHRAFDAWAKAEKSRISHAYAMSKSAHA